MTGRHRDNLPPAAPLWAWVIVALLGAIFLLLVFGP